MLLLFISLLLLLKLISVLLLLLLLLFVFEFEYEISNDNSQYRISAKYKQYILSCAITFTNYIESNIVQIWIVHDFTKTKSKYLSISQYMRWDSLQY